MLQVAQFSAELERYQPAIQIYEDVARTSMDSNLLKYSAKGYLLNAGICRLCGEPGNLLVSAEDHMVSGLNNLAEAWCCSRGPNGNAFCTRALRGC
jgi:hypothetical protein